MERLFLERHFERLTVTGSVTSCPEVSQPVMDETIEVHNECVESQIVEGDLFIVKEGTPEAGVLLSLPVGCCPLRSIVGPMKQHELANILQGALAAYGRYKLEQKQQVSLLAAQLLDAMTQCETALKNAAARGCLNIV